MPWVGRGIPASEDSIRFGTLSDVHSDDLGNVYVADSANNAIVKISDAGKVVKVFTTRNCVPSTFTIDDKQNIFVPCSKYDAKVQRIDPEGRLHDFYKGYHSRITTNKLEKLQLTPHVRLQGRKTLGDRL